METSLTSVASAISSSQALQATSLVGKKVGVLSDQAQYNNGEAIKGTIEIPESANDVVLEIKDAGGNLVKSISFNTQPQGDTAFTWNGLDDNGAPVANGVYQISARGSMGGGEVGLNTYIASQVQSVSINKNGQPISIQVDGHGSVSLSDIKNVS